MGQLGLDQEPILAAEAERDALRCLDHALAAGSGADLRLAGPDGEIVLPPSVGRALRRVVEVMLRGEAVQLTPVRQELTTQEAAALLNVSRPTMVRLLERGAIPYSRPGSHRRVQLSDVLAFKRRQEAEQELGLRRLTEIAETYGSEEAERAYYAKMRAAGRAEAPTADG